MNLIEGASWNKNRRQNNCYKEYTLTLAYFLFWFFSHSIVVQFPAIYNFSLTVK